MTDMVAVRTWMCAVWLELEELRGGELLEARQRFVFDKAGNWMWQPTSKLLAELFAVDCLPC